MVGLSVWSFYPPSTKVNLGLDLKGGVHMIMARTDGRRAANRDRNDGGAAARDACDRWRSSTQSSRSTSPTEFVVEGIQNDQGPVRQPLTWIRCSPGRPGAGSCTYTMRPNLAVQLREEAVTQALQTIERRVNELGVAEPIVARQGAADQILVQLPGVTDVARAKEIIRSTALLELNIGGAGPLPHAGGGDAGVSTTPCRRTW